MNNMNNTIDIGPEADEAVRDYGWDIPKIRKVPLMQGKQWVLKYADIDVLHVVDKDTNDCLTFFKDDYKAVEGLWCQCNDCGEWNDLRDTLTCLNCKSNLLE